LGPLRFESPVPALTGAWERAIPLLAARVTEAAAEVRRGGRPASADLTAACWMAHALVVAGEREPARDLAHVLARAVERGQLPAETASALPVLLTQLEAWTGDTEWTGRYALALGLLPPVGESGSLAPLAKLLDDAGPAWSTGDSAGRAAGLLHGVVYGMWGAMPDAPAARLRVAPRLPAGWQGCALLGLRVGATTLDLALRIRPAALVLRVSRTQGPPLDVVAAPPDSLPVEGVTLDEEPLGSGVVRFAAGGDHEVVWTTS